MVSLDLPGLLQRHYGKHYLVSRCHGRVCACGLCARNVEETEMNYQKDYNKFKAKKSNLESNVPLSERDSNYSSIVVPIKQRMDCIERLALINGVKIKTDKSG